MNWPEIDHLLDRLRRHRRPLVMLIDLLTVAACWNITYLFRLGFERWLSARPDYDALVMAGLVVLYGISFALLGVPRGMWRFSGFSEVKRLTVACAAAGLAGATVVLMAHLREVPRAVLALHPVVTLMGLAMVRIVYRMFYEHVRSRIQAGVDAPRRALVLGAGDAAKLLIAGIQHQGWTVVGCLDDDPVRAGTRIGNVPVLGLLEDMAARAASAQATHLIVALPSAAAPLRRRILELASTTRLPVLTVPSASELRDGRTITNVRDIEPGDLLGREPVALDEAGMAETLGGRVVLITGAGGSIGSELCRQVARYGPSRIVLLELSEYNLYSIEQELSERFPHLALSRLIGDVKDLAALRHVMAQWRPNVVFHAAAYKHVPLMEIDNAWFALCTNVLGTYNAAQAAAECGAERFVLISTDKAVNPTNVMGATKRAAELVVRHLSRQGHRTRFMAVRFGNVLGSSGSVIPKFKEQIARGGPVTVTHPDITRYFMTIPEAARLVIQAGVSGETGQVFVLEMGEPVRIAELAAEMIRLSGRTLDEVPIVFSGLRAGEKLHEELLADADTTMPTAFADLRVARLGADGAEIATLLDWIREQALPAADADVKARLVALLPEYRVAP